MEPERNSIFNSETIGVVVSHGGQVAASYDFTSFEEANKLIIAIHAALVAAGKVAVRYSIQTVISDVPVDSVPIQGELPMNWESFP